MYNIRTQVQIFAKTEYLEQIFIALPFSVMIIAFRVK